MFMVFSKDKIISYLVSIGTVALLFVISFAMTKNNEENNKDLEAELSTDELLDLFGIEREVFEEVARKIAVEKRIKELEEENEGPNKST